MDDSYAQDRSRYGRFAPLPRPAKRGYALSMKNYVEPEESMPQGRLSEWRLCHPEFTDREWEEAMMELKPYLKIAWNVYRQQYPHLDLPDSL